MRCPNCGETSIEGSRQCPRCGRPLLQSLVVRRYALVDEAGRQFELPIGVTRIGRDPASNEIVLTEPSVSARHAAIEASASALVLRDLGSTNGTRANGHLLNTAVMIHEGDVIAFGERELRVARMLTSQPRPTRGIPMPVQQSHQQVTEPASADHLSTAVAAIALTLLATLLHTVGIVDGFQRDTLPAPLALVLAGLVALPLAAIALIAASRRSGYALAALSAVIGLAFVAVAGPIFAGGGVRSEITAEYGTTGYWFIAGASVFAMVVEILVLTVAIAGWRVLQPEQQTSQTAAA